MFPIWSDWDFKYTKKGLAKKRAKTAIAYLAIFGVFAIIVRLQANPQGMAGVKVLLVNYVKSALLFAANFLKVIEQRI